jgi:hypothetical protein
MKASKCCEVGQTRRRRGISMKMRMKEEMLCVEEEEVSMFLPGSGQRGIGMARTDKQSTLQRMMMSKWKMFAIPSAKQRMMQRTPVLVLLALHAASGTAPRIPLSVYT